MHRHVCFYVPQHVLEKIAKYRTQQGEDISEIRQSIQASGALRENRLQYVQASFIPQVPGPRAHVRKRSNRPQQVVKMSLKA